MARDKSIILVAVFTTELIIFIIGLGFGVFFAGYKTSITTVSTTTVNHVNVYWLGEVKDFNSSTQENYILSIGHGINYTISFDGWQKNYTIESVYTNTSGFSVNGIFWEGYKAVRYNLPESVYAGTNFPFEISIIDSFASNSSRSVNLYVITSSVCCYFNGTNVVH